MDFGNSKEMKNIMAWVKSVDNCLDKKCPTQKKEFSETNSEIMQNVVKGKKNSKQLLDKHSDNKKMEKCSKKHKCFKISKKDYASLLADIEKLKEKIEIDSKNNPFLKMVVKKMDELVKKFNDAVKDDNSISSLKNSLKKKRSGNKK